MTENCQVCTLWTICADFLAGAHMDSDDPEIMLDSISRYYKFLPTEGSVPRRSPAEGLMSTIPPKRPRLKLHPEAYRELYRQVLQRDSWRCYACGTMKNLQVHHLRFRSRSGDDETNLITLCVDCHNQLTD